MKAPIKKVKEALEATGGFQAQAAKMLCIQRSTLNERIKNNPELQECLNDILESRLDLVESKLMLAIKDGKMAAIQYYLDHKGRNRGYGKESVTQQILTESVQQSVIILPDNGRQ